MRMPLTLGELANKINGVVHGDAATLIERIDTLAQAGPGAISFLANLRYRKYLATTKAAAVILSPANLACCPVNALVCDDPYVGYALAAQILYPKESQPVEIPPSAVIDKSVKIPATATIGQFAVIEENVEIGEDVYIGPGCVVGKGSVIQAHSSLLANITICQGCYIGQRVIIHPGVVIGSDGFGIALTESQTWIKIPQLGGVRIGDDVEIGSNTTIDRGALEDTVLEDGVKLDNLIQIAHNVHIGQNTAIAACVGIAGSTSIGKNCTIAGGVGILGHLEITDHVHITAMTLVTKSINQAGSYSSGTTSQPSDEWRKNCARFKRLNKMERRIRQLEQ